ncbi:MAG: hypothetical protein EHM45_20615 [Desulfobacteraceae bacterium]|nr:MAG: hypothetical protein EHM45_20615 [Desulfobacteraceae bacterium]
METGTLRSERGDFNRIEDAELCLELTRSLEAAYTGYKNPGEAIGSWGDEYFFLLEQIPESDRPPLEQVYRVTNRILLTQARYGRAPLARRALQNPQAFLGSILAMMHCAPIDF